MDDPMAGLEASIDRPLVQMNDLKLLALSIRDRLRQLHLPHVEIDDPDDMWWQQEKSGFEVYENVADTLVARVWVSLGAVSVIRPGHVPCFYFPLDQPGLLDGVAGAVSNLLAHTLEAMLPGRSSCDEHLLTS